MNRMAAAKLEFDPGLGIRTQRHLPGTTVHARMAGSGLVSLRAICETLTNQCQHANELTFLLFILSLKVGWPMHTPFSQEVWGLAMKDGTARAQQILMIVFIFHEKSGRLPQLNIC
ncbi:hypothetical protein ACU4GD_28530 [Cupriavidus basilensis]